MSARLNLASNPFRNRALPWTVATVIAAVSVIGLLFIAQSTVRTDAKVQAAQRDVSDLRQRTNALNNRAKEIETALTPEQKKNLKSAHTLIDRKRFSWARLFADLEAALPGGVRVTRIAVKEVRAQDDHTVANLDLIVASKSPVTVTQMIQDMESGGVFHAELVSQNLQRGKGESGAEYEMNVYYVPRAGAPIEPNAQNNRPVDTASEGGRPR